MNYLVLYNEGSEKLGIWKVGEITPYWVGEPYIVWRTLEIAISYGWEVVGEL